MMYGLCVERCEWCGLCGICIFENKYFVCERVSVRSFDGCEIFRIFTLMKRTKY